MKRLESTRKQYSKLETTIKQTKDVKTIEVIEEMNKKLEESKPSTETKKTTTTVEILKMQDNKTKK